MTTKQFHLAVLLLPYTLKRSRNG